MSDDTREAAIIRDEAREDLRRIEAQGPAVDKLAQRLARSREQNHFGDDIQITFRPRGGAA